MLEFDYQADKAPALVDTAEPVEIRLPGDDETYMAHPPTSGQFMLVMAGFGSRSDMEKVRATIDFLDSVFEEDGRERFRERLMDRDDAFDIADVNEIVSRLLEHWTARPTKSSSASQSSHSGTGRKSTAKPRSTARS